MIIALLSFSGLFKQAELGLYDIFFRIRGDTQPGSNIVIVAIDEKSIAEIGPLPWPRKYHARLLEDISEAEVVAFDLLFDFPAESKDDQLFLNALKENGNSVLASMFTYKSDENNDWFQQIRLPYEELRHGAAETGFINVPVDKGNVIRRITVVDTNYYTKPYPSFSLATALRYYGLGADSLEIKGNRLVTPEWEIALDSSNQILINFWGPGKTFPTYSYKDVLSGEYAPDYWSGKVVLVGVTSPVMMDYFENPFTLDNMIMSGSLPAAGVEIHASAVKTIVNSSYYQAAPWYVNLLMLLAIWLLSMNMARKFLPWPAAASAIILGLLTFTAYYLFWLEKQLWFNLFAALFVIVGTYSGIMVENFVHAERERRWIRDTFSRYVSSDYVQELVQNPGKIRLGGEKRMVTVLFADLRNFTAFCEQEKPEFVISRLNEFFRAMTDIVFKYEGTLDKFNGDGFMAFFGAPVYSDKHADNGVKASMAMIKKMDELNMRWAGNGYTLQLGIGLNSGSVIVGNIGSEKRMDYTVIGRVVNLASKLENLNKEYGTDILIGEETINRLVSKTLLEEASIKELGHITVPGLAGLTKVFTFSSTGSEE